jgi:2-amino-4-hydroxy-6-hydroxymethyldihydropteridine diphosphokinase
MKRVYLSLGSNLGDRLGHLQRAIEELGRSGLKLVRISSYYRTEPVEFLSQGWFVNCVAEVETDLMPLRLLSVCKQIERELGRRRGVSKGPRAVDIDILLYDNAVIRSPDLVIPHGSMAERRFVLAPLAELAPELRHPVSLVTMREMLYSTRDTSRATRIDAK